MNFPVAFLISISMNYATKLSTGCRQICRCRGTRTDRQIWIKLRYLLSYSRFFKRPVLSSLQRRAGSGTDCPTIQSGGWKRPTRAEMSREGVIVAGGWKCGRCAWNCWWGRAESPSPDKIALPVSEHPPARRRWQKHPPAPTKGVGAYVSGGQAGESDDSWVQNVKKYSICVAKPLICTWEVEVCI